MASGGRAHAAHTPPQRRSASGQRSTHFVTAAHITKPPLHTHTAHTEERRKGSSGSWKRTSQPEHGRLGCAQQYRLLEWTFCFLPFHSCPLTSLDTVQYWVVTRHYGSPSTRPGASPLPSLPCALPFTHSPLRKPRRKSRLSRIPRSPVSTGQSIPRVQNLKGSSRAARSGQDAAISKQQSRERHSSRTCLLSYLAPLSSLRRPPLYLSGRRLPFEDSQGTRPGCDRSVTRVQQSLTFATSKGSGLTTTTTTSSAHKRQSVEHRVTVYTGISATSGCL